MEEKSELILILIVLLSEIAEGKKRYWDQIAFWREDYENSITPISPHSAWPEG